VATGGDMEEEEEGEDPAAPEGEAKVIRKSRKVVDADPASTLESSENITMKVTNNHIGIAEVLHSTTNP
jgi:hypothetical protein